MSVRLVANSVVIWNLHHALYSNHCSNHNQNHSNTIHQIFLDFTYHGSVLFEEKGTLQFSSAKRCFFLSFWGSALSSEGYLSAYKSRQIGGTQVDILFS